MRRSDDDIDRASAAVLAALRQLAAAMVANGSVEPGVEFAGLSWHVRDDRRGFDLSAGYEVGARAKIEAILAAARTRGVSQ